MELIHTKIRSRTTYDEISLSNSYTQAPKHTRSSLPIETPKIEVSQNNTRSYLYIEPLKIEESQDSFKTTVSEETQPIKTVQETEGK